MLGLDIQHATGKLVQHLGVKEFTQNAVWLWQHREHHSVVRCAVSGVLFSANMDVPFADQLLQLWEEEHVHKF